MNRCECRFRLVQVSFQLYLSCQSSSYITGRHFFKIPPLLLSSATTLAKYNKFSLVTLHFSCQFRAMYNVVRLLSSRNVWLRMGQLPANDEILFVSIISVDDIVDFPADAVVVVEPAPAAAELLTVDKAAKQSRHRIRDVGHPHKNNDTSCGEVSCCTERDHWEDSTKGYTQCRSLR